jgi:hypothetical protein
MEELSANPFAMLTFIVAPAILTNASSINALATSNRLGRATERAREISSKLEGRSLDEWTELHLNLLAYAERRIRLLVRALAAFYLSIGAFAASALVSLVGAGLVVAEQGLLGHIATAVSLTAGLTGVGGLVVGSGYLVWESRLTLRSLSEETTFMLEHHTKRGLAPPTGRKPSPPAPH